MSKLSDGTTNTLRWHIWMYGFEMKTRADLIEIKVDLEKRLSERNFKSKSDKRLAQTKVKWIDRILVFMKDNGTDMLPNRQQIVFEARTFYVRTDIGDKRSVDR